MKILKLVVVVVLSTPLFTNITNAQNAPAAGATAEELAKKLSNPAASLVSVPFQNNTDFGIGPNNGSKNTLNFQPVIPIALSPKLNLITRIIVPFVSQRDVFGEGTSEVGLSDVTATAFFSPSIVKNGFIWGVGPALLIPTATNTYLGTGKFGVGPSALALKQTGPITFGLLFNQIWSVAGSSSRADVSQLFMQPFFSYNWKSGAGLGVNSEMTQNWKASTFTAYINPLISAVTKLGTQAVQIGIGPRIPVTAAPGQKPDFGFRGVFTLVFPK
jgi:hypothetical protein